MPFPAASSWLIRQYRRPNKICCSFSVPIIVICIWCSYCYVLIITDEDVRTIRRYSVTHHRRPESCAPLSCQAMGVMTCGRATGTRGSRSGWWRPAGSLKLSSVRALGVSSHLLKHLWSSLPTCVRLNWQLRARARAPSTSCRAAVWRPCVRALAYR